MKQNKFMSEEAFNELIDGFEIVGSLTEYGRENIKYHVKRLQEENQQLKKTLINKLRELIESNRNRYIYQDNLGEDWHFQDLDIYGELLEAIDNLEKDDDK